MALDPRTKLYLVALANLLLFFHVDVVIAMPWARRRTDE